MFPNMCRKLPWRNIDVKTVSHAGVSVAGVPLTPRWPWHAIWLALPERPGELTSSQYLPGCVSS